MQNMENNRLEMAEPAARASIEALLLTIHQQIDAVRRQIQDHMDDHPDLKSQKALLLSIPGIGETTAAMLLAFLSPLTRFHSAKQVVAYAGLNPRIRESGQWAGKSHIAKAGNVLLRKALYLPAVVAKRYNPVIAAFCDRLLARGKCPMQVIVAAMRRLLHIAFGVLKSGLPFNPNHALA
ncbi:IS110 family transposase, partial [Acidithiobacillus ferrianus]|uniref:IS110 family transposase n=1 Tax=Acidithiobacillus ferrianus TaxID=2678518 RepID=UPI0034E39779